MASELALALTLSLASALHMAKNSNIRGSSMGDGVCGVILSFNLPLVVVLVVVCRRRREKTQHIPHWIMLVR